MIRPLRNNIIIKRVPDPEEHWLIPDCLREKSLRGEIIAAGPEAKQVEPGDVILFGQHASVRPYSSMGAELMDSDDELLVLSEMDVLGVVSG